MVSQNSQKRNIVKSNFSSSFFLLINNKIIEPIELNLTKEEFCAFLEKLNGLGSYEARNLTISYLWSKNCDFISLKKSWGDIFNEYFTA